MNCATCQFETDLTTACDCGAMLCSQCREGHVCVTAGPPPLWPHQQRALDELDTAMAAGEKAICVTAPTGGGKTRLILEIAAEATKHYKRAVIYSNRKLITTQSSGVLQKHGVRHGVMAAGHSPRLLQDVQIASVQTIASRVYNRERWQLPEADIVIVDEAHANVNPTVLRILADHAKQEATIIGFTATPVGLGDVYTKLIVAGTNSELRQCGALVPCVTYGPDEPDLQHVRRDKAGEYLCGDVVKAIMVQKIFGHVYDWWRKLNLDGAPTILFAPGVPESLWFVGQFAKRGVTAAHIDAKTSDDEREDIIQGSREGRIQVVCNRFVLREGVDMPWLAHCIMATAFGALSNFLQAGGRLLRAHPSFDSVTLQCHGGSWHRFGSLNADRQWTLNDTDRSIAKAVQKNRETAEGDPEPICCPKCGGIRMSGPKCPFCGHQHKQSVRCVVQQNGDLKRMRGKVTKKKRQVSDAQKRWDSCYYAKLKAKNAVGERGTASFHEVRGWYKQRFHHAPPLGLNNMPAEGSNDWNRRVNAVPRQQLRRAQQTNQPQPQ